MVMAELAIAIVWWASKRLIHVGSIGVGQNEGNAQVVVMVCVMVWWWRCNLRCEEFKVQTPVIVNVFQPTKQQ